jgi:hypothetical protein
VNMAYPYVSSAILLALGALSVVFIVINGKRNKALEKPPVPQ